MQKAIQAIKDEMYVFTVRKDQAESELSDIELRAEALKTRIASLQQTIDELNQVLASLTGADIAVEK